MSVVTSSLSQELWLDSCLHGNIILEEGINNITTNPLIVGSTFEKLYDFDYKSILNDWDAYNQTLSHTAQVLLPIWENSKGKDGWVCGQTSPLSFNSFHDMIKEADDLQTISKNMMIKIPSTITGCQVISELIKKGYSINATFLYSVSQFADVLHAIEKSVNYINNKTWRMVITFMIGRATSDQAFASFSDEERRWLELYILSIQQKMLDNFLQKYPTLNIKILLCSLRTNKSGTECWHVQKTWGRNLCYTLKPDLVTLIKSLPQHDKNIFDHDIIPKELILKALEIPFYNMLTELHPGMDFCSTSILQTNLKEIAAGYSKIDKHLKVMSTLPKDHVTIRVLKHLRAGNRNPLALKYLQTPDDPELRELITKEFPINVYTVGVFDLLHNGHMEFLNKCKTWAAGGNLTVGVHSDKDVRSYKRSPINDEQTRINMIKHLKCVDHVVPYGPLSKYYTSEWYKLHNIDCHVAGEDASCYTVQKDLGIFSIIPSNIEVHTTNLLPQNKRIMVLGVGDLGAHIVNFLATTESRHEIILAGPHEDKLIRRKNLVLYATTHLGIHPKLSHVVIDVMNEDKTAATLAEIKPDIIMSCVSLQSWRIITQLPKSIFDQLDKAEFGPWLPMHLAPMYSLMKAVRASGIKTQVVNAAFPDAVNHVLSKVGLAPTIGVGNVANMVPALRHIVASLTKVDIKNVEIRFAAQHFVSHAIPRTGILIPSTEVNGPIYDIKALINGQPYNINFEKEVFPLLPKEFRRTGGIEGQLLTAGSAMSVLHMLLNNKSGVVHAPGWNGLIGGYPIKFVDGNPVGVDVESLNTNLEDLIEINKRGTCCDGIDSIDDDGTVHFRSGTMEIMKNMLDYHVDVMKLNDVYSIAQKLGEAYKNFADKHK